MSLASSEEEEDSKLTLDHMDFGENNGEDED